MDTSLCDISIIGLVYSSRVLQPHTSEMHCFLSKRCTMLASVCMQTVMILTDEYRLSLYSTLAHDHVLSTL